MGRKLSDIKHEIELEASNFKTHIEKSLSEDVLFFVQNLSKQVKVYIFSGVIRDFFLGNKPIRDLDLVIDGNFDVETLLRNLRYRKNSFGGFKIEIDNLNIDLWNIQQTWGIKHRRIPVKNIEDKTPLTAFFNFSAILFDISESKFICKDPFASFIKTHKINLVFKPNANIDLCVVNSLYYADKLKLELGDTLITYLRESYNKDRNYDYVQIKHFGSVLYSGEEIKKRIRALKKESELRLLKGK